MLKIAFRVLTGNQYGWGNFDRQYNLALYLKNYAKIFFFVENSKEAFDIANKKFTSYFLKNKISLKDEKKNYKDIKFDILIYEGERLPKENQKYYSEISKKFVIFDDNLSKTNYLCDIIFSCQLNSNFNKINPKIKKKIKYGYKFFPIYIKKKKINIAKHKPIILTLGGGYYYNSYKTILDYFKKRKKRLIIFTNNNEVINKLKKNYKDNNFKFYYNLKNIFTKFPSKINFAIVNGGYNKILFNYLKIPTIILSTRYHQIDLTRKFCKISSSCNLGYYKNLNKNKLDDAITNFENISKQNQNYIFKSNNLASIKKILFS